LHFGVSRDAGGHVEQGLGGANARGVLMHVRSQMILNITCGVRDVTLAMLDGSLALADFTEGISCLQCDHNCVYVDQF
jgi:hypothetical protein